MCTYNGPWYFLRSEWTIPRNSGKKLQGTQLRNEAKLAVHVNAGERDRCPMCWTIFTSYINPKEAYIGSVHSTKLKHPLVDENWESYSVYVRFCSRLGLDCANSCHFLKLPYVPFWHTFKLFWMFLSKYCFVNFLDTSLQIMFYSFAVSASVLNWSYSTNSVVIFKLCNPRPKTRYFQRFPGQFETRDSGCNRGTGKLQNMRW